VLVLNGAYIYNKTFNKPFTRTQLLHFVTYYNNHKLGKLITVLTIKGYIEESGHYKQYLTYKISEKGIELISSLSIRYEEELYSFCSSNGIEL
jgi:hypothetical protein